MYRNIMRNTTIALGTLLVSSSLVFAAGLPGSVTALDGKGMGTVRTTDGKDHQVKAGQDFKVGSKVDCEMKNNAMECRVSQAQSAVQPSATTPAPATAAVKPKMTTPAPTAQTPAQPTVAPTAPAHTSSATPSSTTPAPASK